MARKKGGNSANAAALEAAIKKARERAKTRQRPFDKWPIGTYGVEVVEVIPEQRTSYGKCVVLRYTVDGETKERSSIVFGESRRVVRDAEPGDKLAVCYNGKVPNPDDENGMDIHDLTVAALD